MNYTQIEIAKMIDHAVLNPSLSSDQLEEGIQVALKFDVASVCILPYYVERCSQMLKGSTVKCSTTIGFPHGANATATKVAEALRALDDGAAELDMVVNISQVLSANWDSVRKEIRELIALTHNRGQKVKVIFENCYLSDSQKIRLCEICGELQADWIKSSTGFGSGGATIEDLSLMRKHSPAHVQLKAAGGIRDLETVLAYRELGVTRIGTSHTAEILSNL